MMLIIHATIAAAGASLILSTADPLILGLALIGSQLPDLDTTTSTIEQICFPVSTWIEARYPHRTIIHSFVAKGFLAAIALPSGYWAGHVTTAIALPLGPLLACFSDCFTRQGVQLCCTKGNASSWVAKSAVIRLLFSFLTAHPCG